MILSLYRCSAVCVSGFVGFSCSDNGLGLHMSSKYCLKFFFRTRLSPYSLAMVSRTSKTTRNSSTSLGR